MPARTTLPAIDSQLGVPRKPVAMAEAVRHVPFMQRLARRFNKGFARPAAAEGRCTSVSSAGPFPSVATPANPDRQRLHQVPLLAGAHPSPSEANEMDAPRFRQAAALRLRWLHTRSIHRFQLQPKPPGA